MRILRVHGSRPKYYNRTVGGNFRLDALQAAVLRVKLPCLPEWTRARRRNAENYRNLVSAAGLAEPITWPTDVPGHIYNQFVIRVPWRDRLQVHLAGREIATEVYYPLPLHLQWCFSALGYTVGAYPAAERAALETLALPIYPELSCEQQSYVVSSIRDFFDTSRPPAGAHRDDPPLAVAARP